MLHVYHFFSLETNGKQLPGELWQRSSIHASPGSTIMMFYWAFLI